MFCLFAGVFLGALAAGVAVDMTAPVEFAATLPGSGELMCVVASSATHEITSVCS